MPHQVSRDGQHVQRRHKAVFLERHHANIVERFQEVNGLMQDQYKHSKTTAQNWLEGLSDAPPLMELLDVSTVF